MADFLGKATFFEGKLDSCGNGTVTINTGDKLLTVPGNTTAAKGSEVLFAIRPENVKLVSGAHQDAPENARSTAAESRFSRKAREALFSRNLSEEMKFI